ncbi:CapA family protein [Candidatus Dependentiae bacterium]
MLNNVVKILLFLSIAILAMSVSKKIKKNKKEITIGFGGDTMLGRLVNEKIDQAGYAYVWGNVLPLLKKNDLNIINLETTLTRSKKKVPKVFNFKTTPDKVQALKVANIGVVNLANNHMLDFSKEGLIETLQTLKNAGIHYVGAGKTIQEAKKPAIIEKNGIKIGVIGYTDYPKDWKATETKPGTNVIDIGDIEQIKKDIKDVRKKVDLLVLSIHWGPNKRERPTKAFQDFAHQMLDAGIDIIHGHSAHIFQGVERYGDKLILYDTGDFVDDYMIGPVIRNDWSFLFQVTIDKSGIKNVKLIPLLINNMQVNLAPDTEKEKIIAHMKKLSAKFGTKIGNNATVEINNKK